MASLSAHLQRLDDHGRFAFHPDCPICRGERLTGALTSEGVVTRRAQAALLAGVLATSGAAPTAVAAQEPDQQIEGTAVPEQVHGEDPARSPDFDPGGDSTDLPFDAPPVPETPAEPDPSAGDAAPVEQEPHTDAAVPLADAGDQAAEADGQPAPTPPVDTSQPVPAPEASPPAPPSAPPAPPPAQVPVSTPTPEGAIQAASDSFLRQAVAAVCTVEPQPTLWHVYRMLDVQQPSTYRDLVVQRLNGIDGAEFARAYWDIQFPALLTDRGYAAQALNPPRNKLERLISTSEIDTLLRHPVTLDLEGILERGEILIVAGAKAAVGEDNTVLVTQLLLQLLHRAIQAQQDLPEARRRRVSLLIDEAHNVLTPSVAKMLAEGRSAGLEAVFAWQYSAQIRDEVIRSGVRSLLQSLSIFRMREMEDARSLAGLAMEIYSDRISVDQDEQERLRFSPDDSVKLPIHRAVNLWVANGIPRAGFLAATLPMEELHNEDLAAHHAEAQHQRGGYHPGPLGDPLLHIPPVRHRRRSLPRKGTNGARRGGAADGGPASGSAVISRPKGRQLTFGDVSAEERRDDL